MVVTHIHFRSLHLYTTNLGCCDMVLRAEPSQTLCDLEVKKCAKPIPFWKQGLDACSSNVGFCSYTKVPEWTCTMDLWGLHMIASFDRYVILCDNMWYVWHPARVYNLPSAKRYRCTAEHSHGTWCHLWYKCLAWRETWRGDQVFMGSMLVAIFP